MKFLVFGLLVCFWYSEWDLNSFFHIFEIKEGTKEFYMKVGEKQNWDWITG